MPKNEPTLSWWTRAGERTRRAILGLVVFFIVLGVFLPALDNELVDWDDDVYIVDNPHIRGFSGSNLRWMWTDLEGHYQPLSWMTLALDYLVWGEDGTGRPSPVGFHLTNVLLHAANALLVYLVVLAFLAAIPGGALAGAHLAVAVTAALFFGLHPLRVESVAWAFQRKDVLSGLFWLGSILLYLRACRSGRRAPLVLSVVLFALSLLSKTIGMTLPVVLLVLDVYPLRRLPGGLGRWWRDPGCRRVLLEKLPYVAVMIPAAATALLAQDRLGALHALVDFPATHRIAVSAYALVWYLRATVFPLGLTPFHAAPRNLDPFEPRFVASLVLVLAAFGTLAFLRRRCPAALAAFLLYAIMISPVVGVFHIGGHLAVDSYTYLTCLPWAVLTGAALGKVWCVAPGSRALRVAVSAALGLIFVSMGAASVRQIRVWHDTLTLWRHTLSVDPQNALAHYNLGYALADRSMPDEALAHLQEAVRLDPDYLQAHNNLAGLLVGRGDLEGAVVHLREAVRLAPELAGVRANLAMILVRLGLCDEAIGQLEEAVRLDPANPSYRKRLGDAVALARSPRSP